MNKILKLFLFSLAFSVIIVTPVLAQTDLPQISGRAHIQDIGWVDVPADGNHLLLGTVGEGKRIEAIVLNTDFPGIGINYQTHVQDIGWRATRS